MFTWLEGTAISGRESGVAWSVLSIPFGALLGITITVAAHAAISHAGVSLPTLAAWFIGPSGGAAGAAVFSACCKQMTHGSYAKRLLLFLLMVLALFGGLVVICLDGAG